VWAHAHRGACSCWCWCQAVQLSLVTAACCKLAGVHLSCQGHVMPCYDSSAAALHPSSAPSCCCSAQVRLCLCGTPHPLHIAPGQPPTRARTHLIAHSYPCACTVPPFRLSALVRTAVPGWRLCDRTSAAVLCCVTASTHLAACKLSSCCQGGSCGSHSTHRLY
jgi:hypothetical protein